MTQYAFYFDGTRCTGCKTCVFACKDKNNCDLGISYRKVYEITYGETNRDENNCFTTTCVSYPLSMSCNHCSNPACVKACPTGAMHKDSDTGLVSVDETRCIGCGYCHMACPYNAPKVDSNKGVSAKCNGCADKVAAGEKPSCVMSCPARALDFGTVEEMSKKGTQAAIAPLPEPSYTNPNLYINPSRDALPIGNMSGKIVNPLEVQ